MSTRTSGLRIEKRARRSATQRSQWRTTAGGPPPCTTQKPTLRRGRCRRATIRTCKRLATVLGRVASLVNLDRALKVRSILDRNPRRGRIPDHRPVLLDLNAVPRAQVALYIPVNHHFAGNYVGRNLRARSHRQLAVFQLNQSFDGAINQQIFVAGDLTLYMQARTQP